MKKTHLSTRMLSALLALLMVVTSVPLMLAPVTAQASGAEWVLKASTDFTQSSFGGASLSDNRTYSTDTNPTSTDGSNNVMTWSSIEYTGGSTTAPTVNTNGVNVNDGLIYLSGYKKDGIAQSSTPLASMSDGFKIDLEFSFYDTRNFEDWADTGDNAGTNTRYTFMKLSNYVKGNSGAVMNNWCFNDNKAGSYCFFTQTGYGRTYNGVDWWTPPTNNNGDGYKLSTQTYSTNTTYHYILTFKFNTLSAVVTDSSGNTVKDYGSYTNASLADEVQYISDIYLGASNYTDQYYQKIAYKTIKIYEFNTDGSDLVCTTLDQCNTIFEKRIAKMAANGYSSMYTNIGPAYECYKDAKAGSTDSMLLVRYNVALQNMQPFEEYTAEGTPPESTGYAPDETYFNGIIYSEPATAGENDWSENSTARLYQSNVSFWVFGAQAYLYYPNTVLLYDGVRDHTPSIPVNLAFRNEEHLYAYKMMHAYPTTSGLSLSTVWKGYDDSLSFTWPAADNAAISNDPNYNDKSEGDYCWTTNHDYKWNGNEKTGDTYYCQLVYRTYKNSFSYSGTPTEAYTCISSTDWDLQGYYSNFGDHYINTTLTNNDPDIIVINYKMLIDALKAAADTVEFKNSLADMTSSYTVGGLENMFRAFDAATSLDPNTGMSYYDYNSETTISSTYSYSSDMDTAALRCAGDIDATVNMLDNIKVSTNIVYAKKMKSALTAYEARMAESGVKTNLKDAYIKYLKAIEYYDAYIYGEPDNWKGNELQTAYDDLVLATAAIGNWTRTYATAVPYFTHTNAATMASTYSYLYNNVYFTTGIETQATNNENIVNNLNVRFYYPTTTVLLVDGINDVKMPIGIGFRHAGSRNNSCVYMAYAAGSGDAGGQVNCVENTEFRVEDSYNFEYYGKGSKTNIDNPDLDLQYTVDGQKWGTISGHPNMSYRSPALQDYRQQGFVGVAPMKVYSINFGNNYYKDITPTFTVYCDSGNNSNWNTSYRIQTTSSTNKVYAVDYRPFLTKMDANDDLVSNGINMRLYQNGTLKTYFEEMDEMTSFSFSDYFADGKTISTTVGTFNTAMNTLLNTNTSHLASNAGGNVATIKANAGVNEDVTGYPYDNSGKVLAYNRSMPAFQKLKIALLEAQSAPTAQGCINDLTWENYTDPEGYACGVSAGEFYADGTTGALQCAKAAMRAIVDSGSGVTGMKDYGGDSTYTATVVSGLADFLHDSIAALSDINNSSHPIINSYRDGHTLYFQCHSNHSHVLDNEGHTTVSADATAYDGLGLVYKTIDLTKYTSAGQSTVTAGKATYDNVLKNPSPAGMDAQNYLDSATTALLTAISDANDTTADVSKFTVTFNVYTVDGENHTSAEPVYTDASNTNLRYGQSITVTPKSTAALAALESSGITSENMGILRWQLVTGSGTTEKTREFTQKEDTFNVFVQENATVNVYVTELVPASQIAIKRLSGDLAYALNVNDNTTVAISKDALNVINIGGTEFAVTNSLSYNVAGWRIGGNVVADSTTSLNTTVGALRSEYGIEAVTLTPIRELNNRTSSDTYTFTLDGQEVLTNIAYDQKVTVTTAVEGAYAIVVQDDNGTYVPVAYCTENDKSFTFNACRSLDYYTLYKSNGNYYVDKDGAQGIGETNAVPILATTNDEILLYYDNKLPFVYSFIEMTGTQTGSTSENETATIYGNKWTTYSAFTVNSSVAVTEFGTLRTTEVIGSNDFTIDNVGTNSIAKIASSTRLYYSNQYSYSLKTSNEAPRMVLTRAYVKYRWTYSGKEIDAVAYGTPCESHYGIPS